MDYDPSKSALLHPEQRPPFFQNKQQWERRALCAELSRLAYFRFESDDAAKAAVTTALGQVGLARPHFFCDTDTDTQAFATISNDGLSAYLVFRGTQVDAAGDLRNDLDFRFAAWDGAGRVHAGFHAAFRSVRDGVMAWAAQQGAASVCITGHSLGAALATLAAAVLPRASLVTFGSPMVGDAEFAASFAGREFTRFVDCCDAVTFVPSGIVGYRHLEPHSYINRHGVVVPGLSAAEVEMDRAAARALYVAQLAILPANLLLRDMADHAPVNYLRAMPAPVTLR